MVLVLGAGAFQDSGSGQFLSWQDAECGLLHGRFLACFSVGVTFRGSCKGSGISLCRWWTFRRRGGIRETWLWAESSYPFKAG